MNIDHSVNLALARIREEFKARANALTKSFAKDMVQSLGSSISDKDKKPLFHKSKKMSNATAFKFSRINIGGQQSFFKKLGLGTEFFEDEDSGELKKIEIHKFAEKHS